MAISVACHLPHIMFCLTSQNKIRQPVLVYPTVLLCCEVRHLFRPDEAMLETWQNLGLKQQDSIVAEPLRT